MQVDIPLQQIPLYIYIIPLKQVQLSKSDDHEGHSFIATKVFTTQEKICLAELQT